MPGSGRGLIAMQPIPRGEPLLRIPDRLLLTPAAALAGSSLAPLLSRHPLPMWSIMALWLAEARAAGAAGEWWPYLRLLPARTGGVLEWSDAEVQWLRGSELHGTALSIRAAAKASWQEMQPLLAEARGLGPAGAFSHEALQWAFSTLLARLVRLRGWGEGGLEEVEVLAPFADLLNHSPTAGCHLEWADWDAAAAALVLRPDRQYRLGDEVTISYGEKSSGLLLLSYGFSPEPGANPHDCCQLALRLDAADPALAWKVAALRRHGFEAGGGGVAGMGGLSGSGVAADAAAAHAVHQQTFPLRMQAAPHTLMCFAAFAASQPGDEAEAADLARRLLVEGGADPLPPPLQQAALETVVAACQAALRGFASSLEADRAELEELLKQQQQHKARAGSGRPAAAAGEEGSSRDVDSSNAEAAEAAAAVTRERRRQVLQVLVFERQVLNRTVFVLQQELRDVRRQLQGRRAA